MKEGRLDDCGERTAECGLVGEWKPVGKVLGGELAAQCSTSGFTGAATGLVGRGPAVALGGGVLSGVSVLSAVGAVGVELVEPSEALGWGLLAVLLPGEDAVAVLLSRELVLPSFDAAAAFSAFRHFALLFWNHTCRDQRWWWWWRVTAGSAIEGPQLQVVYLNILGVSGHKAHVGLASMKVEARKQPTMTRAQLCLPPLVYSAVVTPDPRGHCLTWTRASVRLIFIASSSLMNTSG